MQRNIADGHCDPLEGKRFGNLQGEGILEIGIQTSRIPYPAARVAGRRIGQGQYAYEILGHAGSRLAGRLRLACQQSTLKKTPQNKKAAPHRILL
jgi:hypothetical protein